MKNKGLKTKLKIDFSLEDDIPLLDFDLALNKKESKKQKIEIISKKIKNGNRRNSSIF